MNIKYIPEKSESIPIKALLWGCILSVVIFSLHGFLFFSYGRYWNYESNTWKQFISEGIFMCGFLGTAYVVKLVDREFYFTYRRFCNEKFIIVYISLTTLIGFYIKYALIFYFIIKNNANSTQLVKIITDPIFIIKETCTYLTPFIWCHDLAFMLIIIGMKRFDVNHFFKENNFYCYDCDRRLNNNIELHLFTNNFIALEKEFERDVNCLLNLPLIDISSTKHNYVKVRIHHCLICKKLNTITIYRVEYDENSEEEYKLNTTYILTINQFEAFKLKQNETKTDFCEILESSKNV